MKTSSVYVMRTDWDSKNHLAQPTFKRGKLRLSEGRQLAPSPSESCHKASRLSGGTLPLRPPQALEPVIRGTDLGLFEEHASEVRDTARKVAILLFL